MSKLIIFTGKVPTPYMRFIDRASFDAWLVLQSNDKVIEIEVSGVNPYTTLWYIDVNLADNPKYKSINWQSEIGFIKVIPDLESQTFYAFVDRVERNELDENSIRIYYKVDWWDTLLTQGVEPYIVGDVVRAHVNDIVKSYNYRTATLDYTTEYAECEINSNQVRTSKIKINDLTTTEKANDVAFYYHLIVTDKFFFQDKAEAKNNTVNTSSVGIYYKGKLIERKIPIYEVILPCDVNGKMLPYYIYDEDIANYRKIYPCNYDNLPSLGAPFNAIFSSVYRLYSDYIVGVYATEFPPYGVTVKDGFTLYSNSTFNIKFISSDASNLGAMYMGTDGTWNRGRCEFTPVIVNQHNYTLSEDKLREISNIKSLSLINSDLEVVPSNYAEYKDRCIIKYLSQYYNPVIVAGGSDTCVINHSFNLTQYVSRVNLDPLSGQSFVTSSSTLYNDTARTTKLTTSFLSQPVIIDKYWDRQIAKLNATKNITNIISSAIPMVSSAYKTGTALTMEEQDKNRGGFYESAVKFVGNAAVNVSEFAINNAFANGALQKGNSVDELSPEFISDCFPYFLCFKYSDEETLENLAFYGYNTHLQPKEILKNHRRKYFNFIKTSSCNIIKFSEATDGRSYNFSAEVRNDIEAMFNGGVWLFNFVDEESLFELEVPNYPLSAGY